MNRFVRLPVMLGIVLGLTSVEASRWSETTPAKYGKSGSSHAGLTDGRFMLLGATEEMGLAEDRYEIFDPATATWFEGMLPSRSTGASSHQMAMLLYSGDVLYFLWSHYRVWDSRTYNWTSVGSAFDGVLSQNLFTMFKDGRVLYKPWGTACKIYDWTSRTWALGDSALAGHWKGTEVLLPSGELLMMGGSTRACDIYDPVGDAWRTTGSMNVSRKQGLSVLLPPPWSQVLSCGGSSSAKSELYDPGTETWTYTTGEQVYANNNTHALALLPSGKALVVGGTGVDCEVYDPDSQTWSATDPTSYVHFHFGMGILPTGKVLAIGAFGSSTVAKKAEIYDPMDAVWTAKFDLGTEKACHTVIPLPIIHTRNCSTNVLIAGGENTGGALKSCELYNYAENRLMATGELSVARSHHTAVLLPSGQVLATGGKNAVGLSSCELYDANTEAWTPAPDMGQARFDHTATLLRDGNVLVTGGEAVGAELGSCQMYDGSTWSGAGIMSTARARHSAVLLLDGKVLVIGGETSNGATDSCEIWDGSNWSAAAPLATARFYHTASLLQCGKVLVVGGTTDGSTALSSCELYDPATDTWTQEGNLAQARYLHNSTLLYSGLVVTTGGYDGSAYLSECEIWDPGVRDPGAGKCKWKSAGTLGEGRGYHASVLVPDIHPYILAIGGKSSSGYVKSVEEYDVGLGYRSEWQPTITSHKAITSVSSAMQIEGTLFRGVSEADGGNHCHTASNDHPVISVVRIGGGNWQGNGGGEVMYMPPSTDWDETHTDVTVPANAPEGFYRMWSIVNGIPCKWYQTCAGVEEKTNSQLSTGNGQLSVYPNPSRGDVNIRFASRVTNSGSEKHITHYTSHMTLAVHDLSGRLVRESTIKNGKRTLKLNNLKPGIYFYKIGSGETAASGKFVVAQ